MTSHPPTPEELEGWEKTTNEASEGPWAWRWREGDQDAPGSVYSAWKWGIAQAIAMCPKFGKKEFPADAEFIATARTAMPALLAEVKRLRGEERTRFASGGYNIGSVEEACVALDELSGQARAQAALLAMRNMEIKKLLEVVPPNLTTEFASTPRTTPRL